MFLLCRGDLGVVDQYKGRHITTGSYNYTHTSKFFFNFNTQRYRLPVSASVPFHIDNGSNSNPLRHRLCLHAIRDSSSCRFCSSSRCGVSVLPHNITLPHSHAHTITKELASRKTISLLSLMGPIPTFRVLPILQLQLSRWCKCPSTQHHPSSLTRTHHYKRARQPQNDLAALADGLNAIANTPASRYEIADQESSSL
jgi:hypothetical protein